MNMEEDIIEWGNVQTSEAEVLAEKVDAKYTRFKGADWFSWLYRRPVLLGGAGGIGSWASMFLSRLGCHIYIYDMDTFERINMSGQLVGKQHIGKEKTAVAEDIAKMFSDHILIEGMGKYEKDSEAGPIMISGFDNMNARKNMFHNWKNYVLTHPEEASEAIWIDGRLLSSSYQIFIVQGDNTVNMERYEEYLFEDSEVEETDCTLKQTTHCAAGIASHMVGFLTNFAANVVNGGKFNQIPFKYEYITEPNFTENVV
jgi:hypothetical protein